MSDDELLGAEGEITVIDPLCTLPNRIAGGLLGLAAGATAADSRTGGGVVRWGSGEARLTVSLARTYAEGYSGPKLPTAHPLARCLAIGLVRPGSAQRSLEASGPVLGLTPQLLLVRRRHSAMSALAACR